MSHLKCKMLVTSMQLELNKTFLMQYSLMKITPFQRKEESPQNQGLHAAVLHSLSLFRNQVVYYK